MKYSLMTYPMAIVLSLTLHAWYFSTNHSELRTATPDWGVWRILQGWHLRWAGGA